MRARLVSLRRLLLSHELAFVLLVVVMGILSGFWAYFWQQTSEETVRYSLEQIRSNLFRQIKEVALARLMEDPRAVQVYTEYSRTIDKQFNTLRQLSREREEDEAVQRLQKSYRVLQKDMNNIFADPYLANRVVRIKILDPRYEQALVGDYEAAHSHFQDLLSRKYGDLESTMADWTRFAPILIPIPILLAGILLFISRRSLQRGFVKPMDSVMDGARKMRAGQLEHRIPVAGVEEMSDLANALNEMAEALKKSQEALVDSERQAALGALVPVVAHNIRNPLATIRANAQLLEHCDDGDELREASRDITQTVDRLSRWVSALVSYLHPLKPQLRHHRLSAACDAAVHLLEPRLEDKDIEVERSGWDVDDSADMDPDLVEQAVYGLMSNAVDASPTNGRLRLTLTRGPDEIRLTIVDQGPGLPFKPEPTGLEPGPSTKRFGTGLGIPVAYKVFSTHGWRLNFENSEDGGTKVTISVPVARTDDASVND
jgi:signal transduction histidine kinase